MSEKSRDPGAAVPTRPTRVLLVRLPSPASDGVSHPQHVYPPMLLKLIEAGLVRTGRVAVRLLDGWRGHDTVTTLSETTVEWQPDLVVVAPHPVDLSGGRRFAASVSAATRCTTVAVGPGADLDPDDGDAAPSYDLVLPGESELTVLELVEACDRLGRDAAVAQFRAAGRGAALTVADLDRLPFPTYSADELTDYSFSSYPLRMRQRAKWGFVLGSRGCPYDCFFCSPVMRKSSGRQVRVRSASHIVDEIEHLVASGVNVVSFEDDDFTARRDYVRGLCDELTRRRLGVRWICHARVDEVDAPLIETMREAGCILLRFGVESASARILQLFGKNPRRLAWADTCHATFAAARRAGIATNALVIVGSPGETVAEATSTTNLVLDLDPDLVQVHFFTLYPGSRAHAMYRDTLDPGLATRLHHYQLPVVNLSAMTHDELWRARADCYRRFLMRPSFLFRHLRHYARFYLANPRVFRHLASAAGVV